MTKTDLRETKMRGVCKNCGGRTFIGEFTLNEKDHFEHTVIRCRSCGAWCGGFTKKTKKKKQ